MHISVASQAIYKAIPNTANIPPARICVPYCCAMWVAAAKPEEDDEEALEEPPEPEPPEPPVAEGLEDAALELDAEDPVRGTLLAFFIPQVTARHWSCTERT